MGIDHTFDSDMTLHLTSYLLHMIRLLYHGSHAARHVMTSWVNTAPQNVDPKTYRVLGSSAAASLYPTPTHVDHGPSQTSTSTSTSTYIPTYLSIYQLPLLHRHHLLTKKHKNTKTNHDMT